MKLPDSALLLLVGTSFGAVLHFLVPDEEFYLKPEWFFLYLLPPIALDAGFFLPNVDFFHNFGTILIYAFVGTILNVLAIGVSLYYLSGWLSLSVVGEGALDGNETKSLFMEYLLFGTLISAVDPVAVLCVFEEVNQYCMRL
jgi:solute carrier family 9 (sodium/hydrogen exchanger), member 5